MLLNLSRTITLRIRHPSLIARVAGSGNDIIELIKDFGETRVAGREPLDGPTWRWPKR